MNKKILIIVFGIGILLGVVGGISIITKIKNNNEIEKLNSYSEIKYGNIEDIVDNEMDVNSKESRYDFDFLDKIDNLEKIEGEITDIKYTNKDLYISTNNKVYKYAYSNCEEIINSDKTIKSIEIVNYETIILKNIDNSYSIYHKDYENTSSGVVAGFKEVKGTEGINLDNIVFLGDNDYNDISLIRQYKEGLCVDRYYMDNDLNITSKELKMPLVLEIGLDNVIEIKDVKQICADASTGFRALLSNGNVYSSGALYSFSNKDASHNKLEITISAIEELNNVDKIYAIGNSRDYKRPLFGKVGDKNNLYTYNNETSLIGIPDEQYKITIPLPTGYTTDDIKEVMFAELLIIEFNDKNIYIADKNNISELVYNEDISTLYKKGKIEKIERKDLLDFVALMDDKCMYELDF